MAAVSAALFKMLSGTCCLIAGRCCCWGWLPVRAAGGCCRAGLACGTSAPAAVLLLLPVVVAVASKKRE
jgi:hypothetical protein